MLPNKYLVVNVKYFVSNFILAHLLHDVKSFLGGEPLNLLEIKKKCEERNISFSCLEKETGIGNGVIAKWENGNPRVDTLKKVADFFGCTIDELMKKG